MFENLEEWLEQWEDHIIFLFLMGMTTYLLAFVIVFLIVLFRKAF